MATLLSKIIKKEETKTYNFKPRDNGIAGVCPDCGCIVSWNSYHSRFQCLAYDCCFEANEKGKRVWDNSMREENLKRLKDNSEISL